MHLRCTRPYIYPGIDPPAQSPNHSFFSPINPSRRSDGFVRKALRFPAGSHGGHAGRVGVTSHAVRCVAGQGAIRTSRRRQGAPSAGPVDSSGPYVDSSGGGAMAGAPTGAVALTAVGVALATYMLLLSVL